MDEEDAYNASDLYIQNLKQNADDVRRLHTDMMTFFTWAMADIEAETHSKPSTNAWTTSTTICMRKSPCPSSPSMCI
ncbi:MAG: hypothetical protein R2683_03860 [Bifidobacterium adolescentis]